MKKIASIGLLLLLLYNMFGLTITMLFFETNYRTNSNVIFDDKWKIIKIPTTSKDVHYRNGHKEGLIRSGNDFYNIMHEYQENDTLYVILKSNQNAQERFAELASMVQGMTAPDSDISRSPLGKLIKLLGDLQKVYVSDSLQLALTEPIVEIYDPSFYTEPTQSDYQVIHLLHSPPPELT
ncbi:hypothetical protein [Emticicia sp. BO119]|uniref:hypothetical protein n=1 Tax=Emticicia sp. BO119 TaxID=2757768 RepID=UPI0015EFE0FC|nr:hypothetical protein [Emticicia sp. BO119]MBA4853157.1 hypothetical protein [Emticicia sp. BO119]